ncbi:MAG: YraN family protein [Sphingomonadales bacterium]|nr:YraN family protein [Sphingomonadales bacterium]
MSGARELAEARGRRGEGLAAWYLRLHGWRIVGRRLQTPRGEVDMVARRGRMVAFVEVKWRADVGGLDRAIDGWRLRRVIAAAEVLAPRYVCAGDCWRIDVLLLAPGRWPRHIVNASMNLV